MVIFLGWGFFVLGIGFVDGRWVFIGKRGSRNVGWLVFFFRGWFWFCLFIGIRRESVWNRGYVLIGLFNSCFFFGF